MHTIARVIEFLLGLFFIASAVSKAADVEAFAVQISLYGVVESPSLLKMAAFGTIFVEATLGALFLAGSYLRGLPYAAGIAMTVVFTGLIAYAWRFEGLEDCGCFGEYLSMSPGPSILKNVVLIAVLGATGWALRSGEESSPGVPGWRGTLAAVGFILAVAPMASQTDIDMAPAEASGNDNGTGPGPYAKYTVPTDDGDVTLNQGRYLVALLSATCEHCMASVDGLNTIAASDDTPKLVGLMFGDDAEISMFLDSTGPAFPTTGIPALEFMTLVTKAPPELVVVDKGHAVHNWVWEDNPPSVDEISSVVEPAPAS